MDVAHLVGFAPLTFAGAAAMTFGAAFVRGLTGFGMAIILVPLLGMLMPPGEAVVLGIILQLLIGPVGFRRIANDADRRTAVPIGLLAMVATPIGMLALKAVSPDVARLLIAIIAIGAFLLILMPQHPDGHRPGAASIGLTGVASGVLTGFAAMPGPPVVPFYLRQRIDPAVARASMMLVFFATAIAGTLASLWLGLATKHLFVVAVLLFVPMWLGDNVGTRLFGRVPVSVWRSIVAVVLGVAGLSALLRLLN
ncbi:MAG: sulfite exporter TauE/SafE family protein [Sphingomonadales bacterium]|nr:sulfite exporter TauE/SafE family protein [Sphingomonadales bacterium]